MPEDRYDPVLMEKGKPSVGQAIPPEEVLASLAAALATGRVRIIELTQPLSENTPILKLPEPFVNTPGFKLHELSCYDDNGPAWYWNSFESGEHVGTHFDAPIHWVTGRDKDDVSQVPLERLIGPAVVIDKAKEAGADADYLLSVDDLQAFQKRHGPLPEGGWLLYRTGWDAHAGDQGSFLNADETGPHTPGIDVDCARWLAEESPLVGIGVETVGTDAGAAHSFDPAFPCHHFLLGSGKYGVTQLANLAQLPPTGSLFLAAPLRIEGGSGSPCRALALVPS
jgi:kynurenine formamidase